MNIVKFAESMAKLAEEQPDLEVVDWVWSTEDIMEHYEYMAERTGDDSETPTLQQAKDAISIIENWRDRDCGISFQNIDVFIDQVREDS